MDKTFSQLMETECSLPRSQEPASFPYLILNNPVFALPFCFFKINYNVNLMFIGPCIILIVE